MRTNFIKAGATAIILSLVSVNQAYAACLWNIFGSTCTSGGGQSVPPSIAAPEIDGAGAFVAIALVMSIAAIVYRRVQR